MPRTRTKHNSCHVNLQFKNKSDAAKFYCNSGGSGMQQGCNVFKCVEGDKSDAEMLADDAKNAKTAISVDIEFYDVELDDDDSLDYWMDASDDEEFQCEIEDVMRLDSVDRKTALQIIAKRCNQPVWPQGYYDADTIAVFKKQLAGIAE